MQHREGATARAGSIIPESGTIEKPAGERPLQVMGVIPARLASTRLPRKVLRLLAGRPLLAWVYEAAMRAGQMDQVVIAADSDEVMELCAREGWPCEMTSPELASGTDRIHAVAQRIPAEIYINIQGDEPLLRPEHVAGLLRPFGQSAEVAVTTLKVRCTAANERNPNAVKVVTASDGRALYFSRATIPYDRDGAGATYWKHLGLYAYRRSALERFPHLQPSSLERTERLEQLRFLENGVGVYVEETETDTVGVDTEDDLRAVDALLRERERRRGAID